MITESYFYEIQTSQTFFLFVTVSILTSLKEKSGISSTTRRIQDVHLCSEGREDDAGNISCKKMPRRAAQEC